MNEPEKKNVLDDIVEWLDAHTGHLASQGSEIDSG